MPYDDAWELQRELHAQRVADEIGDVVLLLEHPSVYTAGKRTEPADRPVDGTPVVEVDRGGKITWHGPGQLVGYPIIKLPDHVYVVDYVRRLEEALIRVCADLGLADRTGQGPQRRLAAAADDGRPERKIAALGVRVSRGVTMHGLALNCDNAMDGFDAIVPCGIADAGVTTLTAELGRDVTVRGGAAVRRAPPGRPAGLDGVRQESRPRAPRGSRSRQRTRRHVRLDPARPAAVGAHRSSPHRGRFGASPATA